MNIESSNQNLATAIRLHRARLVGSASVAPFSRVVACLAALLLFSAHLTCLRAEVLAEDDDYLKGDRALASNLPGVAASHFLDVINRHKDNLTPSEQRELISRLMESSARMGGYQDAVTWAEFPVVADVPGRDFWYGISLANTGRHKDAAEALKLASGPGEPHRFEAVLFRAQLLQTQGENEEALGALRELFEFPKPAGVALAKLKAVELLLAERQTDEAAAILETVVKPPPGLLTIREYLKATTDFQQKKFDSAEPVFQKLSAVKTALPGALRRASAVRLVETLVQSGKIDEASKALQNSIEESARPDSWPVHFNRLIKLASDHGDVVLPLLSRMKESDAPPFLASYASYYECEARHEQGDSTASTALIPLLTALSAESAKEKTDDFVRGRARYLMATIHIEKGNATAAMATLEALRTMNLDPGLAPRVLFLQGMADFTDENYTAAADAFRAAAANAEASGLPSQQPLYNVAISAIAQNSNSAFAQAMAAFTSSSSKMDAITLELERALFKASRSPNAATKLLQEFVLNHAGHPRLPEAYLTLAELRLSFAKPDVQKARTHLKAARTLLERQSNFGYEERLDHVNIWIADTADREAVTAACLAYLGKWPSGAQARQITFKLAETYFSQGDYPSAQANFEKLALTWPESELAEPALFFAGRAALLGQTAAGRTKAISIWADVAKAGGPLSLEARRQQAAVKRSSGASDPSETSRTSPTSESYEAALALLNEILKEIEANPDHPGNSPSLLHATLYDKGDVLFLLSSNDRLARIDEAIGAFNQLIDLPGAPLYWKNKARFRKAACYEKDNRLVEALRTYNEVIDLEGWSKNTPKKELFWYYTCGFAAVRILAESERWESAVAILDRMGRSNGYRSDEAKRRSSQLKLEHFIWEKKPQ